MKRTQVCRPNLCDNKCEIAQEWDDEDDPPIVRSVGLNKRCRRHKGLSPARALEAIAEQDRLEGKVWAAVSRIVGVQDTDNPDPEHIHGDHVAGALSMDDDGTLHVALMSMLRADHAQRIRSELAGEKILLR